MHQNHRGQVNRPERVNQGTCPYDPLINHMIYPNLIRFFYSNRSYILMPLLIRWAFPSFSKCMCEAQ